MILLNIIKYYLLFLFIVLYPNAVAQVSNGQAVNATVTNGAFIFKNSDDTANGKISLNNSADPSTSGSSVSNIQRELNSDASFIGKSTNQVYNLLPTWINNDVGSSSDPVKTRADNLTVKFNATTGHAHSGSPGDGALISYSSLTGNPTFKDGSMSIVNTSDATKVLKFSLGGMTTGQTLTLSSSQTASQTLAFPSVGSGDSVVTLNTTQTLTNKTLTSPSITTPSVDVPTFAEQGSDPSTPASAHDVLYFKANHLFERASTGTVTQVDAGASGGTNPTVQKFTSTGTATGYLFTISTSSTLAIGDTYTNNSVTFTALNALSTQSGQILFMSSSGAPTSTGTLTRSTGSGTSSITFTAEQSLATYTRPTSPTPLYIRVVASGGGGGGSGNSSNSSAAGSAGGTTTFGSNLILLAGGGGGAGIDLGGGAGGTAIVNSGPIGISVAGGAGNGGSATNTSAGTGIGGANMFGGAGRAGANGSNGSAGAANTGAGGGGGGGGSAGSGGSCGGGGAAAYADVIINSPASSYFYSIGTGGSGAGSTVAGGSGGNGVVIVYEYYQ